MMAKPIKTLELDYPVILILINCFTQSLVFVLIKITVMFLRFLHISLTQDLYYFYKAVFLHYHKAGSSFH